MRRVVAGRSRPPVPTEPAVRGPCGGTVAGASAGLVEAVFFKRPWHPVPCPLPRQPRIDPSREERRSREIVFGIHAGRPAEQPRKQLCRCGSHGARVDLDAQPIFRSGVHRDQVRRRDLRPTGESRDDVADQRFDDVGGPVTGSEVGPEVDVVHEDLGEPSICRPTRRPLSKGAVHPHRRKPPRSPAGARSRSRSCSAASRARNSRWSRCHGPSGRSSTCGAGRVSPAQSQFTTSFAIAAGALLLTAAVALVGLTRHHRPRVSTASSAGHEVPIRAAADATVKPDAASVEASR